MTPERWQQVERIYQEAAGLSPSRRAEFLEEPAMGAAAAVVYKARDTRLKRTVAIKVLPRYVAADEDRRKRLLRAARIASALNHPHIVTIHDVVSGYGQEVCRWRRRSTTRSKSRAHAAGIVHRLLKPGNIIAAKAGVKVLDFGLAKHAGHRSAAGASAATTLTVEHSIVGTLAYTDGRLMSVSLLPAARRRTIEAGIQRRVPPHNGNPQLERLASLSGPVSCPLSAEEDSELLVVEHRECLELQ